MIAILGLTLFLARGPRVSRGRGPRADRGPRLARPAQVRP
jgi:hypothetical protein